MIQCKCEQKRQVSGLVDCAAARGFLSGLEWNWWLRGRETDWHVVAAWHFISGNRSRPCVEVQSGVRVVMFHVLPCLNGVWRKTVWLVGVCLCECVCVCGSEKNLESQFMGTDSEREKRGLSREC